MVSSFDPNTVCPSSGGVVPGRASYVLDPRPLLHGPSVGDLRSQLHDIVYRGRIFMTFLSILLGDDQALDDEGVTSNKREKQGGVWSGTSDYDTMQLHGGELANPTATFWLLENLKNKAITLGFNNGDDFFKNMKMVLNEVLKFGARATDVAKVFARMEFHRVKPLLVWTEDLRSTLQGIAKEMETKLPLIDPLLLDIEPSNNSIPIASYILEPQPPRVGSNAGDLVLQLRAKIYKIEQFHIFIFILLGEDQSPDVDAIVHDRGGASSSIDHDSLQPHGGEPVAPMATVWLLEYLKRRQATPGYNGNHCWDQLRGPFKEVMKFGARATDVAKAFARMDIDHVEYLLVRPQDLLSMLQKLNTIADDKNTRELIKMFMPDVETDPNIGIPLDALPDKLLPDIEPVDDDYIKLSVYNYFGNSKD